MLKEILLTGDERDTILGLCQHTLNELKGEYDLLPLYTKLMAARVGMVICRVKGHVPHYNEAYVAVKGGWKRQGDVWEFPSDTVIPNNTKFDFSRKHTWY